MIFINLYLVLPWDHALHVQDRHTELACVWSLPSGHLSFAAELKSLLLQL